METAFSSETLATLSTSAQYKDAREESTLTVDPTKKEPKPDHIHLFSQLYLTILLNYTTAALLVCADLMDDEKAVN
jgi:hypothetical protein